MLATRSLPALALLVFSSIAATIGFSTTAAAEDAVILKTGIHRLSHDPQSISDNERDLDASADTVLGLAWERRTREQNAYGVEFTRFNNDWRNPGNAQGTIKSRLLMATLKRYQEISVITYPYVGVGAGLIDASASGMNFKSALGLALQIDAGVEFRWDLFGIYTELRGLYAQAGDFWGDRFNASGIGLFAGVSLRF